MALYSLSHEFTAQILTGTYFSNRGIRLHPPSSVLPREPMRIVAPHYASLISSRPLSPGCGLKRSIKTITVLFTLFILPD
jgi:hypothetical protein